jgi:hypothetical protein
MRALAENGGALAPTPPADYSIYDLATAMATARQVRTCQECSSYTRAKKYSLYLIKKLALLDQSHK